MTTRRYSVGVALFFVVLLASIIATVQTANGSKLSQEERMNNYRKRVSRLFIEEQARKPGVVRLPSGLVIERLVHGSGIRAPSTDDKCEIYYTGALRDGTIFDKSEKPDGPRVFRPQGVISGWNEALQLMREGDRWRLYIPYELGYGEQGAGNTIPGFSALVFEIELVRIIGGGRGRTVEDLEEFFQGLDANREELDATCVMSTISWKNARGGKPETAADTCDKGSMDATGVWNQHGEASTKSKGAPASHICTHDAPPLASASARMGTWPWLFAVILLLLVVGHWGYERYMESTGEGKLMETYLEYLRERWSQEGDALLANTSLDRSFTRYGDRRIYFRVSTRKIPVPGTAPTVYQTKFGLPEVDNDNRWRGDDDGEWRILRENMRCVGDGGPVRLHSVGRLSNGLRFTSSYVMQSSAEERAVKKLIPCLRAVLSLMCEGDKWEMVCAPEEGFGNFGEGDVPPAATTLWRISVENVEKSKPRTRGEAEALLAASVSHAEGTPAMSRRRLFEVVNAQLDIQAGV